MNAKRFLWLMLRILAGIIFAYAGFSKLVEPYENFRGMINQYEIVPYAWSTPIALVMPWFELIFGVFMIAGYLPKLTAVVLAGLSTTFLIAIGGSQAIFDHAMQDCGCFGQSGPIHLKVWQVFIMDFLLLLINIRFYLQKTHPFSLDALLKKS